MIRWHRHVWIENRAEIVFDDTARLIGIRHVWVFDPVYSAYLTMGLDADQNGSPVMVHQTLGKLAQDRDPHGDVEPVEDVLAARADPLSKDADLVPAIRDKGQILIGLKALTPEMIDDAALRLAIIAMHEADVPGVPSSGMDRPTISSKFRFLSRQSRM